MFEMTHNLAKDSTGLHEELQYRMKKAGAPTLRQLSLQTGVAYCTLRDCFQFGAEIGIFKAKKVADFLDVKLDEFEAYIPRKQ